MTTPPAHLVQLLEIIETRGIVESLLRQGLYYSQIAELLNTAKEQQLIAETNDGLQVTERGRQLLRESGRASKGRKDHRWIVPLDDARTDRIPVSAVFLPREVPH